MCIRDSCNLAGGIYGDNQNPHYFRGWAPLNEEAPAAIFADDPQPVRVIPETQRESNDEKSRTKQPRKPKRLSKSQRKRERRKQIEEAKSREYAALCMQIQNDTQGVPSREIKPKPRLINPKEVRPGVGERDFCFTQSDGEQPGANKNFHQTREDEDRRVGEQLEEQSRGTKKDLQREVLLGFYTLDK